MPLRRLERAAWDTAMNGRDSPVAIPGTSSFTALPWYWALVDRAAAMRGAANRHRASLLLTAALPVLLSSCATPRPHQAFHNTDDSALIVAALDNTSCEVIAPTAVAKEDNMRLLNQAKSFSQHQTAVVILENYYEPQLGQEFRNRTPGARDVAGD